MSKLTTNTADLQAILDKVNALPDAGSGGTNVKTCSVVFNYNTNEVFQCSMEYTTLSNNELSVTYAGIDDVDGVVCNTLLFLNIDDEMVVLSSVDTSGGYVDGIGENYAVVSLDGVADGETVTITINVA